MSDVTPCIRREMILDILINRDNVSATELAIHFNRHRSTIYRDLDYLQQDYIIERVRARGGGYRYIGPRLNREYVLSKRQIDIIRRIGNEVGMNYQDRVEFNSAIRVLEKQAAMIRIMEEGDL